MAKGQMRSNKETKKPKQDKKPVTPAAAFLSQTKNAEQASKNKK